MEGNTHTLKGPDDRLSRNMAGALGRIKSPEPDWLKWGWGGWEMTSESTSLQPEEALTTG